jgi:diguanylate cyclase (GGDEF)-like protein
LNLLLLPDFFAMLLLTGVLLMVRGREEHGNIRLWTAGLMLILLECAARILYGMPSDLFFHRTMHAVALDAYLLAGAVFLRSGSTLLRRMPRSFLFLWLNVAPHFALLTVYGYDGRTAWVYHLLVGLGIAMSLATCVAFKRPAGFYVAFVVLWTPMVIATNVAGYRTAIYIVLAFLYGLTALTFSFSLPKGSRGKIAVVAGFTMWSLCFLTHPWIAEHHAAWTDFASEVWNMQKFIITVGLLLVMLERQIKSNEWLALHDELTGLPNRRLFDDRLQNALGRAERDKHRVALFTLDLDGFKSINDTLGHDAGDLLLQRVAKNLEGAIRKTDTLARLGGDEFSLIAIDLGSGVNGALHPILLPQTQRIFTNLLQAVELPVQIGVGDAATQVQVSASVGVAVFPDDGREANALIRLADQRMYEQKSARANAKRAGTERRLPLTGT